MARTIAASDAAMSGTERSLSMIRSRMGLVMIISQWITPGA
jgi:hypothetical protein